jgi:hypothetical protein
VYSPPSIAIAVPEERANWVRFRAFWFAQGGTHHYFTDFSPIAWAHGVQQDVVLLVFLLNLPLEPEEPNLVEGDAAPLSGVDHSKILDYIGHPGGPSLRESETAITSRVCYREPLSKGRRRVLCLNRQGKHAQYGNDCKSENSTHSLSP